MEKPYLVRLPRIKVLLLTITASAIIIVLTQIYLFLILPPMYANYCCSENNTSTSNVYRINITNVIYQPENPISIALISLLFASVFLLISPIIFWEIQRSSIIIRYSIEDRIIYSAVFISIVFGFIGAFNFAIMAFSNIPVTYLWMLVVPGVIQFFVEALVEVAVVISALEYVYE